MALDQIARGRSVIVGDGRNRKSMAYVDNVAAFLAHVRDRGPGLHAYNYVDKPDLDMNRLIALATRAYAAGRVVIVGGHHPFSSLDERSQGALTRLIGDGIVQTYISAHTHWGQYFAHPVNGRAWLEPNLGSVLDYNAEWTTLELGKLDRRVLVQMGRTQIESITNGHAGAELQVDGGIDARTAVLAVDAGASCLVAGTAVFGHPEGVGAGIRALREALSGSGVAAPAAAPAPPGPAARPR